jgi:hypothetical protein
MAKKIRWLYGRAIRKAKKKKLFFLFKKMAIWDAKIPPFFMKAFSMAKTLFRKAKLLI